MADNILAEQRTLAGDALTELILKVFRANGRLLRAGDQLGKDLSLTSARWQVMGAIDRSNKTVAQIAREFELTRQGVLWVVQALAKEGLVQLTDNPDHRRAKLVQFTAHGRTVYDEMNARQIMWINTLGKLFDVQAVNAAAEIISQLSRLTVDEPPR